MKEAYRHTVNALKALQIEFHNVEKHMPSCLLHNTWYQNS